MDIAVLAVVLSQPMDSVVDEAVATEEVIGVVSAVGIATRVIEKTTNSLKKMVSKTGKDPEEDPEEDAEVSHLLECHFYSAYYYMYIWSVLF